jgi:hypothetical protein
VSDELGLTGRVRLALLERDEQRRDHHVLAEALRIGLRRFGLGDDDGRLRRSGAGLRGEREDGQGGDAGGENNVVGLHGVLLVAHWHLAWL